MGVIWNCTGCRRTMYTSLAWRPRLCYYCLNNGAQYATCDGYYLLVVPRWP